MIRSTQNACSPITVADTPCTCKMTQAASAQDLMDIGQRLQPACSASVFPDSSPPRLRRALLLLALTLLAEQRPALAQVVRPPAPLRMLILGVTPYGKIASDGRPSGLLVDLTTLLASKSGMPIDCIVAPFARAIALMTSGKADLLLSVAHSRLNAIARPLALAFKNEVIVIGRSGTHFSSLAELHGKTVGHIRGAEYDPAFHADSAINKYETNNIEQTVLMLLDGRFDAVIGFRHALFYVLKLLGQTRQRLGTGFSLGTRDVLLFQSLRSPERTVSDLLSHAMDTLRLKGNIQALNDQYFEDLPKL